MNEKVNQIAQRLQNTLYEKANRESAAHEQFLHTRQDALEKMAGLIELQAGSVEPAVVSVQPPAPPRFELFSAAQMHEFATGSMARCFGPEFQVFDGRRYPRIPNRDLMLMSRALEIQGKRGQFDRPASILTEYDVPEDAWFYRDNAYPSVPYSVWMEIALQPCGFLSAYLGTSLLAPEVDFYFRNLDGNAKLHQDADVRGKTIQVKARLLSTIISGNTIIQKFEFEVSCAQEPILSGGSIFGFFPPETMANQAGLDAGKRIGPAFEQNVQAEQSGHWFTTNSDFHRPHYSLPVGQLTFLDRIHLDYDKVYAERVNNPQSWFYACHFFQDPVMPGSLGVEAILQAIQAYAIANNLGKQFKSPRFGLPAGESMNWKYRGQILPSHQKMKVEVLIRAVENTAAQVIIRADASLWADDMRIYEVKNAAVSLLES